MTDESVKLARSAGYKLAIAYTNLSDGTNCDEALLTAADTQIDAFLKRELNRWRYLTRSKNRQILILMRLALKIGQTPF